MDKPSEKRPNPPGREKNPGSRVALFVGFSIIVSLIFTVYGAMTFVTGEADAWRTALAVIMVLYGVYGLAVVIYAHNEGGRRPVVAIQLGAAVLLLSFVFIVTIHPMIFPGLPAGILVAFGLWGNWIAVVKIVKKRSSAAAEKRRNYA